MVYLGIHPREIIQSGAKYAFKPVLIDESKGPAAAGNLEFTQLLFYRTMQ
jgi:hypothetical protein